MFARVYSLPFFLFFTGPLMVAATAIPRTSGGNDCNVGTVACCNSVQQANGNIASVLGALGIVVPTSALVGFDCSPSGVAVSGVSSCNANPVCCTGVHFSGLVNVGCNSISS